MIINSESEQGEPLTVNDLKVLLEVLPGDMPVAIVDDGFPHPARWGVVRQWKVDAAGWPQLEYEPASDDEPGDHEGFVPAFILAADYEPGGVE